MGTNRRYGTPAERAELRRRREAMVSPDGRRRVRHCWVQDQTGAAFDDPDAPGLIVEWARGHNNKLWYARVVYLATRGETDTATVVDAWFPYTRLTPIQP